MGINLSEDEKRRIEQEERVRVAENQYRAKVRERIASGDPATPRKSRSRKLLILLVVLFIAYVWIKSH